MGKMETTTKKMHYCKYCVYPGSSAVPLAFDENDRCSGCRTASQRQEIDWMVCKKRFEQLIERYRSKDGTNYDCIIPVSGGKDSYFQIHIIKMVYGLNPLLVTYHGNNYTPTGMKNLINMREAFGADHIFFTPSIETLKVLNRLGMRMMGDMNWHAHAGIFTYPIRMAVQHNVPLMIWGEHGFMDLGGMHSYKDMVEFTFRYRHEHCLRGFEWSDFVETAPQYNEKLGKQDILQWIYPTDDEIERVGVRGIYISNYFKWDANEHGPLVVEKYGFKEAEEPFERTYRRMSNLDDMHENGIHDYMKFVKFGYGRATDHVCKDIRAGLMSREDGIRIVRERDHIKSNDLYRWLDYVGWSEEEFDRVADSFRDPRVWWIQDGQWWKDNIWGEPSPYGPVHLPPEEQQKYT
jgi:N-acetyl sugar amidotransferase